MNTIIFFRNRKLETSYRSDAFVEKTTSIENLAGTIFNLLSFKFKVGALVYLNTCVIVNSKYCCLCLILFGLLTGLVVVRKKTCDRPNSPF